MSTTVELGKATAEIARLRPGIGSLVAKYDKCGGIIRTNVALADLRELLDES